MLRVHRRRTVSTIDHRIRDQLHGGGSYPFQLGSLNDLQVVVFQDPGEADVTETAMLADGAATVPGDDVTLPSSEESFVASFTADSFFGSNGSSQFLDIRFEWADPNNANRWVLIETLQSPTLGDPSLHLGGKVRFYVNIPDCSAFEFPTLSRTPEIGVALLISETGRALPQGFQDDDVLNGSFEFVGVSSVIDPNSANPIPVPTTFIPITDTDCSGSTTGPAGDWRLVEINLATAGVAGWTAKGGDGVLDATGVGDGVNRGVLAGIALTVRNTDTTSQYVEFLIDEITFDAPVTEPAVPPTIVGPVVFGDLNVLIDGITPRATLVTLEIDRDPNDDPNVFTVSETVSQAPGLSVTGEGRSVTLNVAALNIGDRLRARQRVGTDIGDNSLIVTVNPPAAFSATLVTGRGRHARRGGGLRVGWRDVGRGPIGNAGQARLRAERRLAAPRILADPRHRTGHQLRGRKRPTRAQRRAVQHRCDVLHDRFERPAGRAVRHLHRPRLLH